MLVSVHSFSTRPYCFRWILTAREAKQSTRYYGNQKQNQKRKKWQRKVWERILEGCSLRSVGKKRLKRRQGDYKETPVMEEYKL
uniref:Uncharacterized protein n=1 Tax=Rhizophora mucronata TaxID=61149 RepID=A0A2P2QMM4_RHIMU